jgi:hypothetical protein
MKGSLSGLFRPLQGTLQGIRSHPVKRLEELLPDNWKAAKASTQTLPA